MTIPATPLITDFRQYADLNSRNIETPPQYDTTGSYFAAPSEPKVYCNPDPAVGNDTTGHGTLVAPYQTAGKCRTVIDTSRTPSWIIVLTTGAAEAVLREEFAQITNSHYVLGIRPAQGVVARLDGRDILSTWTKVGSVWKWTGTATGVGTDATGGTYDSGTTSRIGTGPKIAQVAGYRCTDQVFLDGVPLKVTSSSTPPVGCFYVDRTNKVLWIGSDPTGKTVEATWRAGVTPMGQGITKSGFTVEGIGIAGYGSDFRQDYYGALALNGSGQRFRYASVYYNSANGLDTSSAASLIMNQAVFVNNEALGWHNFNASGQDIQHVRLDRANWESGFVTGSNSARTAAMKAAQISSSTFDNILVRNAVACNGFWFDVKCVNNTITRFSAFDCAKAGLKLEIGGKTTIIDAQASRCGVGISIASTSVHLENVTLVGNGVDLEMYEDSRTYSAGQPNPSGQLTGPGDFFDFSCRNVVIGGTGAGAAAMWATHNACVTGAGANNAQQAPVLTHAQMMSHNPYASPLDRQDDWVLFLRLHTARPMFNIAAPTAHFDTTWWYNTPSSGHGTDQLHYCAHQPGGVGTQASHTLAQEQAAGGHLNSVQIDDNGAAIATYWQNAGADSFSWQSLATDSTAKVPTTNVSLYGSVPTAAASTVIGVGTSTKAVWGVYNAPVPVPVSTGNFPPTAFFTASASGMAVTVNGSGSSDSDGTIASWDWNWGDSTAHGSGATPAAHTYASANQYTITLTVTDDGGATATATATVTVPASGPAASISTTATGLRVSADGSGSTDGTGTITSWNWNWGDNLVLTSINTTSNVWTFNHPFPGAGGSGRFRIRAGTLANIVVAGTALAEGVDYWMKVSTGVAYYDAAMTSVIDVTSAASATATIDFRDSGTTFIHTYGSANTYTITETVIDNNAHSSTATKTVTLANLRPTVSVLIPADGVTVTGTAVQVVATAADTDGNITGVDLYVDGAFEQHMVASLGWIAYLDSTAHANGFHAIQAVAHDNAGGVQTSAAIDLDFENTGHPVVAWDRPPTPDPADTVSNAVAFQADITAGAAITSARLYLNGQDYGALVLVSGSTWLITVDTRTLADGDYAVTAVVVDANHSTTTTAAFTITVHNGGPAGQPPPTAPAYTGAQLLDVADGVGQVATSVQWEVVSQQGAHRGVLYPSEDQFPRIAWSSGQAIQRTCQTLYLHAGDFADINPLRDELQVWYLVETGERWPIGRFIFGDYHEVPYSWGTERAVNVFDRTFRVDQATERTVVLTPGQQIGDLILTLLAECGIMPTDVDMTASAATVSQPVAWPAGTSRYEIIKTCCALLACYPLYFNAVGRAVVAQVPDLTVVTPTFKYPYGGRIVDGSLTIADTSYTAPNRYIVTGGSGTAPIVGVFDVPADAPHSIVNRGYVVAYTISLPGIQDTASATAAAIAAYAKDVRAFRIADFDATPDPRHDANEILFVLGNVYAETAWALDTSPGGLMHHTASLVWGRATVPGMGLPATATV